MGNETAVREKLRSGGELVICGGDVRIEYFFPGSALWRQQADDIRQGYSGIYRSFAGQLECVYGYQKKLRKATSKYCGKQGYADQKWSYGRRVSETGTYADIHGGTAWTGRCGLQILLYTIQGHS